MKKCILFVCVVVIMFVIGCTGKTPSEPDLGSLVPTPTPVFYVYGDAKQVGSEIDVNIYLFKDGYRLGSPVEHATVLCEFLPIKESATPGVYTTKIFGSFSVDTILDIDVKTTTGHAYCSLIVPEKATVTFPPADIEVHRGDLLQLEWTCINPVERVHVYIIGDGGIMGVSSSDESYGFSLYDTQYLLAGIYKVNAYSVKGSSVYMNSYECGEIYYQNSGNTIQVNVIE